MRNELLSSRAGAAGPSDAGPRPARRTRGLLALGLTLGAAAHGTLQAQELLPPLEEPSAATAKRRTVAEVAAAAMASVVTIHATGRDGNRQGLGTGFVMDNRGLIATNLHVIGEGRAFRVEAAGGRRLEAVEIVAWDRFHDLAVVRVDWQDKPLPPLPLAAKPLTVGEPIVVLGNPLGLKHSVVSGVLSAEREVEGRPMLQLAVPIEPGNSGGPVIDLAGRVHGVVTMKSLLTDNLGFATGVPALRELLKRPTPVPLDKWRHVGGVDTELWQPLAAQWRQRSASLDVRGVGPGFGGRALCLSKKAPPELPYEVAVEVKLGDESGAAGLVFHSDGAHRHYGFYPSNGQLRLTCFLGPTVYSWKVLYNQPSEQYQAGRWNRLKVRVEKDQLQCFVNDQLVHVSRDDQLTGGRVGLAKFRDTAASFRQFEVAKQVGSRSLSAEARQRLKTAMDALGALEQLMPRDLAPLETNPTGASALLERKAEQLEKRAAELREIRTELRVRDVCGQLTTLLKQSAGDGHKSLDLALAALLIAKLDVADLDVRACRDWIDSMARRLKSSLGEEMSEQQKLGQLDQFLFVDNAFHGSHGDYYHRANSHLHRVLDDREGLPITLSVLYITLGRSIGLNVEGVGMPGHFLVRHVPADGDPQLIDVFHGGKRLTRAEAAELAKQRGGVRLTDEHLAATPPRAILDRMLRNLLGVAQGNDDKPAMLRYLEALVTLNGQSASDRGMRAVLRFETGRRAAAVADLDWILQQAPDGLDLDQVRQMREHFLNGRR